MKSLMEIALESEAQWNALREQIAAHGGMSIAVPIEAQPAPFVELELVFHAPGGELGRGRGQVVHLASDGHMSLMLTPSTCSALLGARFPTTSPPDTNGGESTGAAEDAGEKPLWARYETLSKVEKMRLARQGGPEARRLILKDADQSLHPHVLTNPGLTGAEVATLIRSGSASPTFIQRLAQRGDLMSNPSVAEAIVMSPATPVPLCLSLVPKLPIDLVRKIAKGGNLRAPIVSAARKRVLR